MTRPIPRLSTTVLLVVLWIGVYVLWLSVRPADDPVRREPQEEPSPTTVTTRFQLPPGFPKR